MNKVFSKVAVATLMSAVVATAVQAGTPSKLFINHGASYNDSNTTTASTGAGDTAGPIGGHNIDGNASQAISIDIAGQGTIVPLVFTPFVNLTSGSKFTLEAVNAEFVLAREASLCSGRTVVGKLVSVGPSTATPTETMNNMSFRIVDSTDAAFKTAHFAKDGNYTFAAANNCYDAAGQPGLSITSTGDACQAVSVQIPTAIDDSSQSFEDYTTPAIVVGETKRFVSISCDVPVCSIDINDDMKSFTTTATPSGINADTRASASTDLSAIRNSRDYACTDCGDSATTCITTIFVRNEAGADFNVTKLSFTPTFTDNGNAGMTYVIDGNTSGSLNGTFGTLMTLTDFNLSANTEKNITVTYTPTVGSVIAEGSVDATIVLGATKGATKDLALTVSPKFNSIATFTVAGQTAFTVPYMNSNNHGFVKITTLSDKGAKLSVTITDQNGKQATKDLADLTANGTVYLFSDSGDLKDAADAAGLANAWTVDFSTTAAATVVSYMPTGDGERTVIAY